MIIYIVIGSTGEFCISNLKEEKKIRVFKKNSEKLKIYENNVRILDAEASQCFAKIHLKKMCLKARIYGKGVRILDAEAYTVLTKIVLEIFWVHQNIKLRKIASVS